MRRRIAVALFLVLATTLFLGLAACGGGGGGGSSGEEETPNNWDAMKWDTGRWQ